MNSNNSDRSHPYFTSSNFRTVISTDSTANQTMNNSVNSSSFSLNPQASPFQVSHSSYQQPDYPATANFFNLTSISKSKTEITNNAWRPPVQRMNSETRSTSSEQSASSKKHKRELTKLEVLEREEKYTADSIRYYEKKMRSLKDESRRLNEEIKSAERNLEMGNDKLRTLRIDIEREKKRQLEAAAKQRNQERNKMVNGTALTATSNSTSVSTPSTIHHQADQHSPSTQINNLSLNSNSSNKMKAQSTISNVINNLLVKKNDVEFENYDFIFTVVENVYEPKLIDVNAVGRKIELIVPIKKILSKDDMENGLRYVIRGCVYDSKSVKQSDNLSFVKTYDFIASDRKKFSWENSESSSCKQIFPFDISNYSKQVNINEKKLTIAVHLNQESIKDKRIAFGVYLVKRLNFKQTLELVQKNDIVRKKDSRITKNQVTDNFDQSTGIVCDSYKISLTDPLSKAKISWPCVGKKCEHIATFDGLTFLESNSRKFPWFCPICGKTIGYNQLLYDELTKEILKKVSVDCNAIAFDKASNWMPLSEETKKNEIAETDNDDEDCITLE